MRNRLPPAQFDSIEAQARDLGLWPGTQGPEIELYLPGMTPGVDEPILTPGGIVPYGSTLVLTAPGNTIRYFAEDNLPELVSDPKDSPIGFQSATGSTEIVADGFTLTIKARIWDPTTGYSGLSEIFIVIY